MKLYEMPWYDSLVSSDHILILHTSTVWVDSGEMVSMDTTLVHLVVCEVCVTTHQTRMSWGYSICTTCHLLAGTYIT